LRAKRFRPFTPQPSARAVIVPNSMARRLITGSEPGNPRQTGHVWVLGAAPNVARHPQNILVTVAS
jgi:hypothetical protein